MKLAIIGAGGHARMVADAAALAGYTPGFVLPDGSPEGSLTIIDGYLVLGTDENLPDIACERQLVVGIGDNWRRGKVAEHIRSTVPHAVFAVVVHPDATVSARAVLGEGTVVMPQVVVNPGVRIGSHCVLNNGALVGHDNVVGDYVSLAPGAVTGGTVNIGKYTAICIGATVLHNISIGAHSVIGAGALVTKGVLDDIIAYGVPARIIRKRDPAEPYL